MVELDNVMADLQWLEDHYSSRMVCLEHASDSERAALVAELKDIQSLISEKEALLDRLQAASLERERLAMERDRQRVRIDPNVLLKLGASTAAMIVIGFVELKGNGFLNEKLTGLAEAMRR